MRLKAWRRRITDPLGGLGLHATMAAAGCLSYSRLWQLAGAVRALIVAWSPANRRLILANLAVAFPEWPPERREAVCREAIRHGVMTALEFVWFIRNPARLASRVDTTGEAAAALFAMGRSPSGAMLVTLHLGNWELLGQVVALNGVRACAVAHDIRNPYVARVVAKGRGVLGLEIAPEHGAARAMLKALRNGRPIGMLMDQNTRPSEGGIFVDLFGLPVTVSRAPAALARRLGVPVAVFACVREAGRFRVAMATLPKPTAEYTTDEELTQAVLLANEVLIRRYPEQYAWLYRRWRYVPAEVPEETRRRYPFYARSIERDAVQARTAVA